MIEHVSVIRQPIEEEFSNKRSGSTIAVKGNYHGKKDRWVEYNVSKKDLERLKSKRTMVRKMVSNFGNKNKVLDRLYEFKNVTLYDNKFVVKE